MARKTINRKELREQIEAAERAGGSAEAPPTKKAATKRKTKKDPADIRMKLYWGVFNQSLKRVALYEFNQKKQAEQKSRSLISRRQVASLREEGQGSDRGVIELRPVFSARRTSSARPNRGAPSRADSLSAEGFYADRLAIQAYQC